MSLMNRLEIVGLCNKIEELVRGQKFSYGYHQGGVHIGISTGEDAAAEQVFKHAVGKYLMATRHPAPGADPAQARATLIAALDEYVSKIDQ